MKFLGEAIMIAIPSTAIWFLMDSCGNVSVIETCLIISCVTIYRLLDFIYNKFTWH